MKNELMLNVLRFKQPANAKTLTPSQYNQRIFEAFDGLADFRQWEPARGNRFWFREEAYDRDGLMAYKKIYVKASVGRYSAGPELAVMFDGLSYVLGESVNHYPFSADLDVVVMDGLSFGYNDLCIPQPVNPSHMYPVVNELICRRLKISPIVSHPGAKVARYYDHIRWFRQQFAKKGGLVSSVFSSPGKWIKGNAGNTHPIDPEIGRLQFLKGTSTNPMEGLKAYMPYAPPETRHLNLYLIRQTKDQWLCDSFLKQLKGDGDDDFPGLCHFINASVTVQGRHILFTDEENPLPEIKKMLSMTPFDPKAGNLAIYLSPIPPNDPKPERREVYFQIKEELLKYGLHSEAVDRSLINSPGFGNSLFPLSVSILAQYGGIPWQLAHPSVSRDLIIGIGASRTPHSESPYVCRAVHYSVNGHQKGMRCDKAYGLMEVSACLQNAVCQFAESEPQARRLIIHLNKTLPNAEMAPIYSALKELGLAIPVVILTIRPTGRCQPVHFNPATKTKTPTPTWMQISPNTILLTTTSRGTTFPLRINTWFSDPEMGLDTEGVSSLVEMVFRFNRVSDLSTNPCRRYGMLGIISH
ncbi:MAG: hypothetical protein WD098_04865 [Balneolales bacterium]